MQIVLKHSLMDEDLTCLQHGATCSLTCRQNVKDGHCGASRAAEEGGKLQVLYELFQGTELNGMFDAAFLMRN